MGEKRRVGKSREGVRHATRRLGAGRRADASASTRRKALATLAKESDRQLDELIARRLAMPIEQRMNFLRRRMPGGGSCL
jgi:hypothetical protein